MANSDKLAEVVAMIEERNDEFRPLITAAVDRSGEEALWPLSRLKEFLGYEPSESIDGAVNRAKIATSNSGMIIKEQFIPGDSFGDPGEIYLTKYAALLVTVNADPAKKRVALAQSYFVLQADKQILEDEKRLKTRLDVATENRNLMGVAKDRGVQDFARFNGVGIQGLYGIPLRDVLVKKGLPGGAQLLDHACSEELAANLFRITQTAAALRRQPDKSEFQATETHRKVAKGVRQAIISAGNEPPERLPAAGIKIDRLATQTRKRLKPKGP
jgi:DNA-damage-inducible protein D